MTKEIVEYGERSRAEVIRFLDGLNLAPMDRVCVDALVERVANDLADSVLKLGRAGVCSDYRAVSKAVVAALMKIYEMADKYANRKA